MNAEFQWWLLLVGLVIGALLVFLVMADFSRSADEQADAELGREADWIAGLLRPIHDPTEGPAGPATIEPATVEEILRLNREWLAGPALPADELARPRPASADGRLDDGSDGDPADVEGDGAQG